MCKVKVFPVRPELIINSCMVLDLFAASVWQTRWVTVSWLRYISVYATLNIAADITLEEKTAALRWSGRLSEGEEYGNGEREQEKDKVKHGPTGLKCQCKLSSGKSCHRPWAGAVKGDGLGGKYRAISPTATLHPSHASPWLPKPWQHVHCWYSYTIFTSPLQRLAYSSAFPSLSPLRSPPSSCFPLTTLKVRVGCAQ